MMEFILFLSLTILLVGTYFIWPSRWNIDAHLKLGLAITAYFIPIFLTQQLGLFSTQLLEQYTYIMFFGAIFHLIGLFVGDRLKLVRIVNVKYTFSGRIEDALPSLENKLVFVSVTAMIVMVVCYYIMGFIPMFAADPLSAKFFKGIYQEPYQVVALPFRTSYQILVVLIPILLAVWWQTKNNKYFALALGAILLIITTLTRTPSFTGILIFIGVFAAINKQYFGLYLIFVTTSYFLGSAIYYIFGVVFEIDQFTALYKNTDFWSIIALGAPDITDQLKFLDRFNQYNLTNGFTYGKTFFGGLVPFNYPWNPSVWTLTVLNDSVGVDNINSGGLRLPVALWGYTAFGWFGVAVISFFSGVFWGNAVKFAKTYTENTNIVFGVLVTMFYINIGGFFGYFYRMSIYSLPTIFVVLLLSYFLNFGRNLRFTGYNSKSKEIE